jgi:Fungal Zn(2)-Cys(6) binuclear cluster domain
MSEHDSPRSSPEYGRRRSAASQLSGKTASVASIEQTQQPEPAHWPSTLLSQPSNAPAFHLPKSPIDPSPAKAPKVAIPRLQQKGESAGGGAKLGGRHRVMHACEPCRSRKTKCSGEKPSCKHCIDFKVTCTYADGKRDRAKK